MFEFDEKLIELEGKIDDIEFEVKNNVPQVVNDNQNKSPTLRMKNLSSFASTSLQAKEPQTAVPVLKRKL